MCRFCNKKEVKRDPLHRLTKLTDGCEGYTRVTVKLVGDRALKIDVVEEVYDAKEVAPNGSVGVWRSYEYGEEVQIKFCPVCGRKLEINVD